MGSAAPGPVVNVRKTFGVPFDVEQELRREWWLNHGCDFPCLYGDDGEMSCTCCGTDFKRLAIDTLRGVVCCERKRPTVASREPAAAPTCANGGWRTARTLEWWQEDFAAACLDYARQHERSARQLRALAEKVRNPPPGTIVEPGAGAAVRFVTRLEAVRG